MVTTRESVAASEANHALASEGKSPVDVCVVVDNADAAVNGKRAGERNGAPAYVGSEYWREECIQVLTLYLEEHPWGVSPSTRRNHDNAINMIPTVGMILLTGWINSTTTAVRAYEWLNARYTPFQINLWWTLGIATGVYWIVGLMFMALDMHDGLHALVARWKIQPHKRITWAEYRQVLWIVLRNTIFVNIPVSAAVAYIAPMDTSPYTLPGLWTTTWTYAFCLLCEEVGFYVVHRAVHSKRFYAKVHKLHHQFTAPVAFASTYATMTEHLVSNLLPNILGFLFIRSHWSMLIMFFCSLELGTLCTHSDYNIPGLYDALQHDWHHYSFTENFGPTGLVDGILGTNKTYKTWLAELKRRDAFGWRRNGRVELVDKTE